MGIAMNVKEREAQIIEAAEDSQRRVLYEDLYYGSKASFWSTAVQFGLATRAEADVARAHYTYLWNYRGD